MFHFLLPAITNCKNKSDNCSRNSKVTKTKCRGPNKSKRSLILQEYPQTYVLHHIGQYQGSFGQTANQSTLIYSRSVDVSFCCVAIVFEAVCLTTPHLHSVWNEVDEFSIRLCFRHHLVSCNLLVQRCPTWRPSSPSKHTWNAVSQLCN